MVTSGREGWIEKPGAADAHRQMRRQLWPCKYKKIVVHGKFFENTHIDATVAPRDSMLGVVACLARNQLFPTGPDGVPLALLAQLHFSDMRPGGLTSQGVLQFFVAGKEASAQVCGMAHYNGKPCHQRYFLRRSEGGHGSGQSTTPCRSAK